MTARHTWAPTAPTCQDFSWSVFYEETFVRVRALGAHPCFLPGQPTVPPGPATALPRVRVRLPRTPLCRGKLRYCTHETVAQLEFRSSFWRTSGPRPSKARERTCLRGNRVVFWGWRVYAGCDSQHGSSMDLVRKGGDPKWMW